MSRPKTDVLRQLAEANPVNVPELREGGERDRADALLERIFDQSAAEQRPPARRRQRRSHRLALAGALSLVAVAVVALVPFLSDSRIDPAAQAAATLSGRDGVFRVTSRTTTSTAGHSRPRIWIETWASADGRRSHSLVYSAASSGARGALLGEVVAGRDRRTDSVTYAAPRGGTAFPASGEPAAERPHSYIRALLRSGKVKDTEQVTFAGRKAWRFRIETRVGAGFVEYPSGHARTPPYTRRTVLIVDGRSHLPLFLRRSAVVPTVPEQGEGRVTFPRQTFSQRFTTFERLPDSEGARGLEPSPRFRRGR